MNHVEDQHNVARRASTKTSLRDNLNSSCVFFFTKSASEKTMLDIYFISIFFLAIYYFFIDFYVFITFILTCDFLKLYSQTICALLIL